MEIIKLDPETGALQIDWDGVRKMAAAWDLGVRDHPMTTWCKVIVGAMAQAQAQQMARSMTPHGFSPTGAPPSAPRPDDGAWKALAFDQIIATMEEIKTDPAVAGMVMMVLRSDPAGVQSKTMWSVSNGISIGHIVAALQAASTYALHAENDAQVQPIKALN